MYKLFNARKKCEEKTNENKIVYPFAETLILRTQISLSETIRSIDQNQTNKRKTLKKTNSFRHYRTKFSFRSY
jgi:hypothetical protein